MTPEHINHLMSCFRCCPAAYRYCDTGMNLKIESFAEFIVAIKTLCERQQWMKWIQKQHPAHYEKFCNAVTEKFNHNRTMETYHYAS